MYNILIYIYTLIIFDIIYIYIYTHRNVHFPKMRPVHMEKQESSLRRRSTEPSARALSAPSGCPHHWPYIRVASFRSLDCLLKDVVYIYISIIHIIHIELVHIKYFIYHIIHTSMLIYSLLYQNPTHNFRQWQKKQHQKRTPRIPGASHFSRWFWTRILKSDPTIPIPWE